MQYPIHKKKSIIFFFTLLCFPFLSFSQENEKHVMNKEEKKMYKTMNKTKWEAKNIEKNSRIIDIKNIAGEVVMEFYVYKKKDSKTGKKVQSDKFKMIMGGNDRIFNYEIKGRELSFIGVKGWNNMKIITCEKDKLVLDQVVDGDLIRWKMVPFKEK